MRRTRTPVGFVALLFVALLAVAAVHSRAQEIHLSLPLSDLTVTEGEWPVAESLGWWFKDRIWNAGRVPRAVVDGGFEAYLLAADDETIPVLPGFGGRLTVRFPDGSIPSPLTGRIALPDRRNDSMRVIGFRFEGAAASPEARRDFDRAKRDYYASLAWSELPGGAWFRHRERELTASLRQLAPDEAAPIEREVEWRRAAADGLLQTYAMVTGGRALAENLQLDRIIEAGPAEGSIPIDQLPGITVRAIDWAPLIKGIEPDVDPLAFHAPHDHFALFFPSFDAMVTLLDEAKAYGMPVYNLMETTAVDAMTRERYEAQLLLSLDPLSRAFGAKFIQAVALIGSDPYLRSGTDVAVLFQTGQPEALMEMLRGRHVVAEEMSGATLDGGTVGEGIEYYAATTPDRAVSSFVARLDPDTVAVTNSRPLLDRLAAVTQSGRGALAVEPEFVWFRDRYRRGDSEETAFVMITDAAIRRWCSPRWRIGASRRTLAAAALADLHARHVDALIDDGAPPASIEFDLPWPDLGQLSWTPTAVVSSKYNTLNFLTPISEMTIDTVTAAEAEAYRQWLAMYQDRWRGAFDPLGIRLSVGPDRIAADLTILPLIEGSDYREMMEYAGGAVVAPTAGDPHDGALLHGVVAIDADSEPMRRASGMLSLSIGGDRGANALSWLGETVALYVDDDPFWNEMAEARDSRFLVDHYDRVPLVLRADVRDPMMLSMFLNTFRAQWERASPGMITWTTRQHGDRPYVHVQFADLEDRGIYYATLPDALIVSLREDALQRALDRHAAQAAQTADAPEQPAAAPYEWIGRSAGVHVESGAIRIVEAAASEEFRDRMQRAAWSAIPILNEWKRLYPDRDPVEVHYDAFGLMLLDPAGGEYVWNDRWQTMESTTYGHPAEPKDGPGYPRAIESLKSADFGLTFEPEHDGLRARVVLGRDVSGEGAD